MLYYLPTKIYEEKDCVELHKNELAEFGRRAFIITGKNSAKKNGSLDDVRNALDETNTSYTVYDKVEENPSVETVMDAAKVGISNGVDFVIGIGGGSAMDAAKAVAIMIANPDKDAEFLYEKDIKANALSLVEIPTTCGTGSEATAVSILTNHKTKTKGSIPHKVFPNLSLVDAKYLMSAPKLVIANTSVDALGHLLESFVNSRATDYSRMFVKEGLHIWSECKDVLLGEREADLEIYRSLINASTLGGMAIAHTGTAIPHALSYRLTYDLSMPHGKAVGYFLAGYLREADRVERQFLLELAGFKTIDQLQEFYENVCESEKLSTEILEKTVSDVVNNTQKLKTAPFEVDEIKLRRMSGLLEV